MSVSHLEPLLRDAERRAVVRVLRSHPEWTLGDVVAYVERGGARSAALCGVPLRELLNDAVDRQPPLDASNLDRARRAMGAEFDELVLDVLAAAGRPVGAAYLRARVGGPRWKLQASVRRLADAGLVEREGITSATRYRAVDRSEQRA